MLILRNERGSMLETDTAIVPTIIADLVIDELARIWKIEFPQDARDRFARKLVETAENLYRTNVVWRKKVLKNNEYGRNYLFVFMRHWLSAEMRIDPWGAQYFNLIPQSFRNGEALK
jgi:hypothetical protein